MFNVQIFEGPGGRQGSARNNSGRRYQGENQDTNTSNQRDLTPLVARAQRTGALDASNMGITSIPDIFLSVNGHSLSDASYEELVPVQRFIIRGNPGIRSLPEEISALAEDLRIFDAGNCSLCGLPTSFGQFTKLSAIDLSGNRLQSLPDDVFSRMTALGSLNISQNPLSILPRSIVALANLTTLDLSDCQLTSLPDDLGRCCSRIEKLILSGNVIRDLGNSLRGMRFLKDLQCSKCSLDFLPPYLDTLQNLAEIDASSNNLSGTYGDPVNSLPPCLARLNLSSCSLNRIPVSVFSCRALSVLMLNDNRITEFTDSEVANLVSLTCLDLSNNPLGHLPPEMGLLSRDNGHGALERLNLCGCPIRAIPRQLIQNGRESGRQLDDLLSFLRSRLPEDHDLLKQVDGRKSAEKLEADSITAAVMSVTLAVHEAEMEDMGRMKPNTHLILRSRGLTTLPAAVTTNMEALAANVTLIDFSDNDLDDASMVHLSRLIQGVRHGFELNINGNKRITTLPDTILRSPLLCALKAAQTGIAGHLCVCAQSLRELDVHGCRSLISLDLHGCTQLRSLDVSECSLRDFPQGLSQLRALMSVKLNDTKISGPVTQDFLCLESLEELDLSNTDVTAIPPEIALLPYIRMLKLTGSGIRRIPANVIARGTEAVLQYLRKLLPDGATYQPPPSPEVHVATTGNQFSQQIYDQGNSNTQSYPATSTSGSQVPYSQVSSETIGNNSRRYHSYPASTSSQQPTVQINPNVPRRAPRQRRQV